MRLLAIVATLAALVAPAAAQGFSGGAHPSSGWARFNGATGFARPFGHASHNFGSYGTAFLGDPWYASYPLEAAPTQVPVIVLASPAAAAAQPAPEARPAEPLLIEWQGDHYARFSGSTGPSGNIVNQPLDYSEAGNRAAMHPAEPCTRDASENGPCPRPRPSVLVYRDGHREPVSGYSIVGKFLYASGDFWKDGSWTRKIPLAALDLPATLQANHSAGVNFELPSGPNVVVASF